MTLIPSVASVLARPVRWEGLVVSVAIAASAALAVVAPDAGQRGEHAFEAALPHRDAVQRFWNSVDAQYLGTPRPGAIRAADGWLYTSEEVPPPPRSQTTMEHRLAAVRARITSLEAQGTKVVVALLPTKMASNPNGISDAALLRLEALYAHARTVINATSPDLAAVLTTASGHETFFRFDTHWTPEGAAAAATAIGAALPKARPLSSANCETLAKLDQPDRLRGDLLAFAPSLTAAKDDRTEDLSPVPPACSREEGLLDAPAMPEIVLVGTSYSADPRWGFAAFMSRELGQPVLNAAVPGRGPFAAVDALLADPNFRADPPGLVVWEIPVRSLWQPCTGATHDVC